MNKILVVDDQKCFRVIVRGILDELTAPHEILEATNGKEALELIAANKPNLVITDIFMPEMGGVDLIRRLRKLPDPPHIIAMSDGDQQASVAKSLVPFASQLGATFAISKSDIVHHLLSYVESCLDKQKQ